MGVIPGIEFNTFSIIGRCARTGMLGVAITTSENILRIVALILGLTSTNIRTPV